MSKEDQSENVALFSRTGPTYTDENSRGAFTEEEYAPNGSIEPVQEDESEDLGKPVGTDGNGAENKGRSGVGKPPPEEPCAIPPFDQVLSDVHESAMNVVGFGRQQWLLYSALGLALMGDGIELLMIAYILPGAEKDFCMTAPMKGWLGAIAFAGMVFGAAIWGNLADKVGRKPTLMTSLTVNALFTITGAFMPTYWLFLLCRFISGVGIGGSIPIVMAYAGEFSAMAHRGMRLGMLMIFWVVGGVYVSALGWLIIPSTELSFSMGNDTHFHSWRAFMLICVLPVIISIVGMVIMPESPRFLLQVGRDLEALTVYRQVYIMNHTEPGAQYEMPELELPSRNSIPEVDPDSPLSKSESKSCLSKFSDFFESYYQLFYTPLTGLTFLLMILWFSVAFGYYGMSIWFPEYMKRLEQELYFAQTNYTDNQIITSQMYTHLLDNVYYYNTTLIDVNFTFVELRHVTFDLCYLKFCNFHNATAEQTYFSNSIIEDSSFNNTNFYPEKFENTFLDNKTRNSFFGLEEGCRVDFEVSYSQRQVFLETLVSQLAVVPVTVINALLLDRLGRVKLLVGCLFLSGVSVFFIWFVKSEVAVVCINAVFNCLINGAFNSMDVTSTELYPTHLRATGFGFLTCLGRIAAILGNVSFGNLIDVSKAIPILITAAVLCVGGLLAVKLPESSQKIL